MTTPVTTYEDLVQLEEASVQRFASRRRFGERSGDGWMWTTYAEFAEQVDSLRGGMAAFGVKRGDRVAIVSRNSTAWAVVAYATYGLGATFVPMYEAQRPGDWELILQDSRASVVFGRTPEIIEALDAMRARVPTLQHVLCIEAPPEDPRSYAALRHVGRVHPVAAIHPGPAAIAGLIYTSGTTGRPKGVILTHHNITSNVAATASKFPIDCHDLTVAFLPWAHVYGQVGELHLFLAVGAATAFNEDVHHLVDDLREIRPTMLIAVPRIFNKIHASVRLQIARRAWPIRALFEAGLDAAMRKRRGLPLTRRDKILERTADRLIFAKVRAQFGGRLRFAISASAALSPEVGAFIDALGIDVYEGYGLTETSPVVSMNRPGERRPGSVGRPIPGVTIRIDPVPGADPGEGEIVIYGPNVMAGYHERPEETAQVFTPDGGLRTGDLGRLDADGYLFLTGRIKEQYKLENGKYVMPTPLEEHLGLSPYIANVMLYGADRPYNVALVEIDPDPVRAWVADEKIPLEGDLTSHPAVRELIGRELDRLSADFRAYERPRAFVLTAEPLSVAEGSLTPALKLKRRSVVAQYGPALDALYEAPSPRPPGPQPAVQPAHRAM